VRAVFVERFSGTAQGDDDDWTVDVVIGVGATADGARKVAVSLSWSGAEAGSEVVTSNGSGKLRLGLGPFDGDSVTVALTGVEGAGWIYLPELNRSSTTLTLFAPGDADG
jgi:hypothetical protein